MGTGRIPGAVSGHLVCSEIHAFTAQFLAELEEDAQVADVLITITRDHTNIALTPYQKGGFNLLRGLGKGLKGKLAYQFINLFQGGGVVEIINNILLSVEVFYCRPRRTIFTAYSTLFQS